MSASRQLISESAEQTGKMAENFAAEIAPGDWIGLTGPLGAGKSVWARGIGRGLGITDHIVSPTYNLVNFYVGTVRLCHIDLYRVRSAEELIDFDLESVADGDTIVIIEWADNLPDIDLPLRWQIAIERLGEHRRTISILEKSPRPEGETQS